MAQVRRTFVSAMHLIIKKRCHAISSLFGLTRKVKGAYRVHLPSGDVWLQDLIQRQQMEKG